LFKLKAICSQTIFAQLHGLLHEDGMACNKGLNLNTLHKTIDANWERQVKKFTASLGINMRLVAMPFLQQWKRFKPRRSNVSLQSQTLRRMLAIARASLREII
jgi:hypothetical protein